MRQVPPKEPEFPRDMPNRDAAIIEYWRGRAREDAPVALRAVLRTIFAQTLGYRWVGTLFRAYTHDTYIDEPQQALVFRHTTRVPLLHQLGKAANDREWMDVGLHPPFEFALAYLDEFIHAFDVQMGAYKVHPHPWKPGTAPELVQEEEKWALAIMTADPADPDFIKATEQWLRS